MFMVTHAALGALIGEQFPGHPWVAFSLGMASHFLTDIIPHGDSQLYKGYVSGTTVKRALAYVIIDAVATIFFILFIFNTGLVNDRLVISFGIAGSVLPDLIVALVEVTRIKSLVWFHKLHFFFHNLVINKKGDLPFASGFAMQLLLLAALFSRLW